MKSDMLNFFNLGVRKRGVVTKPYPAEPFVPYDGTMGAPQVKGDVCDLNGRCAEVCPTGAISVGSGSVRIDMGRCIFCGECARECPKGAIIMSKEFGLASKRYEGLEVEYHVSK